MEKIINIENNNYWLFRINSKYYDIISYVENNEFINWNVNQYKDKIKKGDRVYLWVSGEISGIIASGVVV